MDILRHIFGTTIPQNYDTTDTDDLFDGTTPAQQQDFKDKNLECERLILDEQDREGRLLPLVSKALRNMYGNKTVDRTLRRLYMRRHRNNCSNKAKYDQIKKIGKAFFGKEDKKDPYDDGLTL
jgi:hypothetical protein